MNESMIHGPAKKIIYWKKFSTRLQYPCLSQGNLPSICENKITKSKKKTSQTTKMEHFAQQTKNEKVAKFIHIRPILKRSVKNRPISLIRSTNIKNMTNLDMGVQHCPSTTVTKKMCSTVRKLRIFENLEFCLLILNHAFRHG